MNAPHWHLILNHLPIVGTPLVAVLLGWGLLRRSADLVRVALVLAIVFGALSYPVYLTGEASEEQVEEAGWFDEPIVERHEGQAKLALIAMLVTAAGAAVVWWMLRGGRPLRPAPAGAVLAALVVSTLLLASTALAGGQIRHEEIRPSSTSAVTPAEAASEQRDEGEDEDEDEP